MTAITAAFLIETALEPAHHYTGSALLGHSGVAATPRGKSLPGCNARRGAVRAAGPLFRVNATTAPWWPAEAPAAAAGTIPAPGEHAENAFSTSPCSLAVTGAVAQPVVLAGPQLPLVQLFPLPSPCPATFAVDFRLTKPADVRVDLLDDRGRKVLGVIHRSLAGNSLHCISLLLDGLGLPPGGYTCQLQVQVLQD